MATIKSSPVKTRAGTIELQNGTIKTSLEKYVLTVLPEEVRTVLRGVAYQELNEQIRLKNNPTQVLVDGRAVGRRDIIQAQRKVSIRFADASLVIKAAFEAYKLLQRVTRIQSPPDNNVVARKNFHLYLNGQPKGLMPGALLALQGTAFDPNVVVRIVGPLVPYGRKLYWNPIGRSSNKMKFTMAQNTATGASRFTYDNPYQPRFRQYADRTVRRIANRTNDPAGTLAKLRKDRPGMVEGANQIVKRIMRRQKLWNSLFISDGWISYGPAKSWGKNSRNDRVPSISIQMAKRGNVRVINI